MVSTILAIAGPVVASWLASGELTELGMWALPKAWGGIKKKLFTPSQSEVEVTNELLASLDVGTLLKMQEEHLAKMQESSS